MDIYMELHSQLIKIGPAKGFLVGAIPLGAAEFGVFGHDFMLPQLTCF
jgi:hypothetical protein